VPQRQRLERKQAYIAADHHADCGTDEVYARQRHVGKMDVRVHGLVEQNYRDGQRDVDG